MKIYEITYRTIRLITIIYHLINYSFISRACIEISINYLDIYQEMKQSRQVEKVIRLPRYIEALRRWTSDLNYLRAEARKKVSKSHNTYSILAAYRVYPELL